MLGTPTRITAVLGSAPAATASTAVLKSFAKAACQAGLHLLLIEPYGKQPVDMRSAPKRREDDKAAREAARQAGRADADKVKSKAGVYLATNDEKLICRYIDAYRKHYASDYDDDCPVNFAIAVGPSKLIVVDTDTAEQTNAFLRDVAEVTGNPMSLELPPTVRSPGKRDEDGSWSHRDGGHFYFTVGEPMPDVSGSMTAPGGYAILWANRYVLIPPSTREEGSYVLSGADYPAPDWLLGTVRAAATAKLSRLSGARDSELSTVVDRWADTVAWSDLLAPNGWSLTARPDQCGCDIWTAPGDHASPKSATAHDTGCSLGRYTDVNAPLHIWTDNPGPELEAWMAEHGTKTLSKLQVAAVLEFGGKVGDAMRTLGVTPDDSEALAFGSDQDSEHGLSKSNMDEPIDLSAVRADRERRSALDRATEFADSMNGQPYLSGSDSPTVDNQGRTDGAFEQVQSAIRNEGTGSDSPADSGQSEPVDSPPDCRSGHTYDDQGDCTVCGSNAVGDGPDSAGQSEPVDSPPDLFANARGLTGDEPDSDTPWPPNTGPGSQYEPVNHPPDPKAEPEPDYEKEPWRRQVPTIKPFREWRDLEPPKFVIDGLVEDKALTALVGAPGVGKSGVVLDMAAAIATGRRWMGRRTLRQKVLYLPGEGMAGAVQRLKAWEIAHGVDVGEDILLGDSIMQVTADPKAWAALVAQIIDLEVGMVIIDTFARAAVGLEENSASDVGRAIRRFDDVRKAANVGVMVVHHTGKSGGSARGSSALNGALDTELTLVEGSFWDENDGDCPGRQVELVVTKQKNAPMPEDGLPMLAVTQGKSFVMTGPSGLVDDPLDAIVTPKMAQPEHLLSVATRVQEFVERFPAQGATRAEIAYSVPSDAFTEKRRDAKTAWRMRINEAVDLAIRYEMIQTLTGTATGARYVPGPTQPGAARTRWTEEAMADPPEPAKPKNPS